jgi:hypothetical protein
MSYSRSGLSRVRALPLAGAAARRKSNAHFVRIDDAPAMAADVAWQVQAPAGNQLQFSAAPSAARQEAFASRKSQARPANTSRKTSDAIAYRLIFTTTFVVFLFASVLERAFHPLGNGGGDTGAIRKSIVAQAKEAANISAVYAFMG